MNEETVSQAEVNNLLLHQKTDFRLQEIDKGLHRISSKLDEVYIHQEGQHRRTDDFRTMFKQEIEEEFVTKADFKLFTIESNEQWKKLRWLLSGAVAVLLAGSWILTQYSVVEKIMANQTTVMERAVAKVLKERE